MPVSQIPVGGAQAKDQNTRAGRMWSAGYQDLHQSTQDKWQTLSPRIEIKTPDPAGNRTRVARLEESDSTDQATVIDHVRMQREIMIVWFEC